MNKLTVLFWGGGQDSTAILYRLQNDPEFREKYAPDKFIVIMSDTGNEHKQTNYYREYIEWYCERNKIPFFFIKCNSEFFTESWRGGIVAFNHRKKVIQSKAFPKSCTDQLKIRPAYKFLDEFIFRNSKKVQQNIIMSTSDPEKTSILLEEANKKTGEGENYVFNILQKRAIKEYAKLYGKITILLGIAKGEEQRVAKSEGKGPKWFIESIEKKFPLIEYGMDRKACQEYIESVGELIPYPSNCIICPFMSLQELLYLYRFNRAWYLKLCQMERVKIERCKEEGQDPDKNLGVWGTKKLLPEVLEEAIEKHGHMTDEELEEYKMSHGHCVMSTY